MMLSTRRESSNRLPVTQASEQWWSTSRRSVEMARTSARAGRAAGRPCPPAPLARRRARMVRRGGRGAELWSPRCGRRTMSEMRVPRAPYRGITASLRPVSAAPVYNETGPSIERTGANRSWAFPTTVTTVSGSLARRAGDGLSGSSGGPQQPWLGPRSSELAAAVAAAQLWPARGRAWTKAHQHRGFRQAGRCRRRSPTCAACAATASRTSPTPPPDRAAVSRSKSTAARVAIWTATTLGAKLLTRRAGRCCRAASRLWHRPPGSLPRS